MDPGRPIVLHINLEQIILSTFCVRIQVADERCINCGNSFCSVIYFHTAI